MCARVLVVEGKKLMGKKQNRSVFQPLLKEMPKWQTRVCHSPVTLFISQTFLTITAPKLKMIIGRGEKSSRNNDRNKNGAHWDRSNFWLHKWKLICKTKTPPSPNIQLNHLHRLDLSVPMVVEIVQHGISRLSR